MGGTGGDKRAMVGTQLANSCPGYTNRLRKMLLSPLGGFISGKDGGLGSERIFANQAKNAAYCMLVSEWAWLRS